MCMRSGLMRLPAKIIFAILVLFIGSCGPEKRYRVLSFFFDGVPPVTQPDERESTEMDVEEREKPLLPALEQPESESTVPIVRSHHEPHAKRQCERCHDRTSRTFLRVPAKDLCYLCHDRTRFQGKYVHGPVAVHQCSACHEPHQSVHEDLLKFTGASLCFICHKEETIRRIPKHADRSDCLNCHDPHTHDNPTFLKQNAGAGE